MKEKIEQTNQNCPHEEIGLYLDGELSSHDEMILEKHFAVCPICLDELNSQKEMLLALDFAFEKKSESEVELPKDFTKIIVANAESRVKGLRSRKERSNALFLCSGLVLLTMLGLGTEKEKVFIAVFDFGRQFAALIGFFFHLLIDFTFGAVVILRSISQQILYSQIFGVFLAVIGLFVFVFALSLLGGRLKRS